MKVNSIYYCVAPMGKHSGQLQAVVELNSKEHNREYLDLTELDILEALYDFDDCLSVTVQYGNDNSIGDIFRLLHSLVDSGYQVSLYIHSVEWEEIDARTRATFLAARDENIAVELLIDNESYDMELPSLCSNDSILCMFQDVADLDKLKSNVLSQYPQCKIYLECMSDSTFVSTAVQYVLNNNLDQVTIQVPLYQFN